MCVCVCVCVCLCVCMCVCVSVCHHVCGEMASLSNMVSYEVNAVYKSSKMQHLSRWSVSGSIWYGSTGSCHILAYNCKTYGRIQTKFYLCVVRLGGHHIIMLRILRSIDKSKFCGQFKWIRVSPKNGVLNQLPETYTTYRPLCRDHQYQISLNPKQEILIYNTLII